MDKYGPISSLTVFFLGIGLLCLTFFVAHSAFANPDGLVRFEELIQISGDEEGATEALEVLAYFIAIGLLLVMGYIAGKITTNGIKMFTSKPEHPKVKKSLNLAKPPLL